MMNDMPVKTIYTPAPPRALQAKPAKIVAEDVNVYYGDKHAIKGLSITIPDKAVSAFIGPSGCGKSTFLRCINRMNDTIAGCRVTGKITVDGHDIHDRDLDVVQLRARVGLATHDVRDAVHQRGEREGKLPRSAGDRPGHLLRFLAIRSCRLHGCGD